MTWNGGETRHHRNRRIVVSQPDKELCLCELVTVRGNDIKSVT
jgi:hypothetical protein